MRRNEQLGTAPGCPVRASQRTPRTVSQLPRYSSPNKGAMSSDRVRGRTGDCRTDKLRQPCVSLLRNLCCWNAVFTQPGDVPGGRTPKEATVFSAELRRAQIPYLATRSRSIHRRRYQETPRLLKPQHLLKLQRAHRRDGLEVLVEDRHAHYASYRAPGPYFPAPPLPHDPSGLAPTAPATDTTTRPHQPQRTPGHRRSVAPPGWFRYASSTRPVTRRAGRSATGPVE